VVFRSPIPARVCLEQIEVGKLRKPELLKLALKISEPSGYAARQKHPMCKHAGNSIKKKIDFGFLVE
jgi:hypothetical protein